MANSAVGFILIGHITPIVIQDERSKVVQIVTQSVHTRARVTELGKDRAFRATEPKKVREGGGGGK